MLITTTKAIRFMSLRLYHWDITQVIQKCEMSTTVSKILASYLKYSVAFITEAATGGVL